MNTVLPRVDTAVTPLNPATAPAEGASPARQAAFQNSLQNLVGQSMKGQVLANLSDGTSLVKVADTSVRMQLPAGAEVGSEVAMTLVAANPRPTFQIGDNSRPGAPAQLVYPEAEDDGGSAPTQIGARAAAASVADLARGATPSASSNTMAAAAPSAQAAAAQTAAAQNGAVATQNARPLSPAAVKLAKSPLTAAEDLPGFDPSAPAPTLSGAARAIATVLTQVDKQSTAPQALNGKTPLIATAKGDAAQVDTQELAQKLHDTVGSSGLFYESHVAEWAQGKRPLPDLQREPQMQKAQGSGADGAQPAGLADPASAQLINQQLHTQEQSRVVWQGEAWAGQKMEWDIARDGPDQGPGAKSGGGDNDHTAWRSGVRFRFPTLGDVSASVVLVGGQVHIQMQAASPETAAALRAHAGALEQSLDAAGSPLSSFSVGQADAVDAAGPAGRTGAARGH
jgi:hypothetical protein